MDDGILHQSNLSLSQLRKHTHTLNFTWTARDEAQSDSRIWSSVEQQQSQQWCSVFKVAVRMVCLARRTYLSAVGTRWHFQAKAQQLSKPQTHTDAQLRGWKSKFSALYMCPCLDAGSLQGIIANKDASLIKAKDTKTRQKLQISSSGGFTSLSVMYKVT